MVKPLAFLSDSSAHSDDIHELASTLESYSHFLPINTHFMLAMAAYGKTVENT